MVIDLRLWVGALQTYELFVVLGCNSCAIALRAFRVQRCAKSVGSYLE